MEREPVCEYLWDWCKWCTLPLIAVIVSSSANVFPPPSSFAEPEKEYFPYLPPFGQPPKSKRFSEKRWRLMLPKLNNFPLPEFPVLRANWSQ